MKETPAMGKGPRGRQARVHGKTEGERGCTMWGCVGERTQSTSRPPAEGDDKRRPKTNLPGDVTSIGGLPEFTGGTHQTSWGFTTFGGGEEPGDERGDTVLAIPFSYTRSFNPRSNH